MATIGVVGRHRSDVPRAWLAPLLALLAIGLLPVLGRSLVWLGTAATDAPAHETTSAVPLNAPASTAAPTLSAVPSVVPAPAASTTPAASSRPARAVPPPHSSAPPSTAVAPPVVVVPTNPDPDPDPDPATVQQPVGNPQDPTSPVDTSGSDQNSTGDPGTGDSAPPDTVCSDCSPAPETP